MESRGRLPDVERFFVAMWAYLSLSVWQDDKLAFACSLMIAEHGIRWRFRTPLQCVEGPSRRTVGFPTIDVAVDKAPLPKFAKSYDRYGNLFSHARQFQQAAGQRGSCSGKAVLLQLSRTAASDRGSNIPTYRKRPHGEDAGRFVGRTVGCPSQFRRSSDALWSLVEVDEEGTPVRRIFIVWVEDIVPPRGDDKRLGHARVGGERASSLTGSGYRDDGNVVIGPREQAAGLSPSCSRKGSGWQDQSEYTPRTQFGVGKVDEVRAQPGISVSRAEL